MVREIELALAQGDICRFEADVIALKYAQAFHGADHEAMTQLAAIGVDPDALKSPPGAARLVPSRGGVAAHRVLWLGMPRLRNLGYGEVLGFGARALATLTRNAPDCRHLALTTHGPGFGLDEVEATLSLVSGIRSTVRAGGVPPALERVTIVERNERRLDRLREAVTAFLDDGEMGRREGDGRYRLRVGERQQPRQAAPTPAPRPEPPHAFVAMPINPSTEDVFYYGIQGPVHRRGLLCERVDQDIFAGDILARIKHRIETAAVIIGDLSGQNPNVYLEVGYAWGLGRPTVLLVNDVTDLRFDVQGQRCLVYTNIRRLEELLARELEVLADRHAWPALPRG